MFPSFISSRSRTIYCAHGLRLEVGRRTLVMGILNVTPDSFSDGGCFNDLDKALAHAKRLLAEGADIIDIGGESTRPGHRPIAKEVELERLLPVITAVAATYPLVPISVDTYKATVADAAIKAGASIINDVWGFQHDAAMATVVARTGAAIILVHHRGDVLSNNIHAGLDESIDIVADAEAFFERVLAQAAYAGVRRENIILDPGVGFGKTHQQNLAMVARLGEFQKRFGVPVLLGASRKSFLAQLVENTPDRRLPGSVAAHVFGVVAGVQIVRAHDVAATVQAVRVADAILSSSCFD